MNKDFETVYENEQWVVYEDGDLDRKHGSYWIRKERLLESDWPLHLARKDWTDIKQFCRAYVRAISYNNLKPDLGKLKQWIEAGYDEAEKNLRYNREHFLKDLNASYFTPQAKRVFIESLITDLH